MKKPNLRLSKSPEETLGGTEKTRSDFEVCNEGTEKALSGPEFGTEGTDETLRDPDVGSQ